ncbi:CG42669, partial [Drosophila busckii]
MLAIKECLIREGVLNLDRDSQRNNQFQLQTSKSSGNMDMHRYHKTIAASSDIFTASATAKTSCQQKQQQQLNSKESFGSQPSAYRGQRLYFHHHTTPAYYTDLQLRIHTPNASDVGALNENYQSVYSTPSSQLVEKRCFPKSTGTDTVTVSFFRRGDVTTEQELEARKTGKPQQRCAKSLPSSVSSPKGEVAHSPSKRTSTNPDSTHPDLTPLPHPSAVAQASQVVGGTNGRSSRHHQRFQQRSKRAVRVRSESRPISALYDIICKEKGLQLGESTTTASSSSNEEEEAVPTEQLNKSNTLATFWPLPQQPYYTLPNSNSMNSGKHQQQVGQLEKRHTNSQLDEAPSHKVIQSNLNAKATSLPPPPPPLPSDSINAELKLESHQRTAHSLESNAKELQLPIASYEQGEVLDTLTRWQKELSSASVKTAEPFIVANGQPHHHYLTNPEHQHHFINHQKHRLPSPNTVDATQETLQQSQRHHHLHQATNARRFITRTPRSGSRQSAGHSPPPPSLQATGYHSDSSYSSPSPTRKRETAAATFSAINEPQSSTNGNSSAYETAATTVMTHDTPAPEQLPQSQLQQQQVEVPKATSPTSLQQQQLPSPTPQSSALTLRPTIVSSGECLCYCVIIINMFSNYSCQYNNNNNCSNNSINRSSRFSRSNNNTCHATPMPPFATAHKTLIATTTNITTTAPSPSKRRKNLLSPLRIAGGGVVATALPQQSPLGLSGSPTSTSPISSPTVRTTKASRLRAAALDRKKEEEHHHQQRYSSPCSPRISANKSCNQSGFNSEPSSSGCCSNSARLLSARAATTPPVSRRPLVATANNVSMKQNLSELHFTGGVLNNSPKAECTLRMRPRSSTMCNEAENLCTSGAPGKPRDLTNLQLSPVQKNKRTPELSPTARRGCERDKSAKRKSNLNRSHNEEATKNGDETATTRRRRRRELAMTRTLLPGEDESVRELLQSPQKSSCSESTSTRSDSLRQALNAATSQKFIEGAHSEVAETKKTGESAQAEDNEKQQQQHALLMGHKSTDDLAMIALMQNSPPAPNQIVSILKKKEHAFGECNASSASSNASPVTFSSSVLDTPLTGGRRKRQGILKKRSSLDESRYYSRSHSPDERSILIKSARRNSLEEAGTTVGAGQAHGILKQSSYESNKSDGCPSANECQPHSILKKKDSLSTPSDGGCSKHVSISQAVTLAAAELAAHAGCAEAGEADGEIDAIRPILKQESTSSEETARPPKPILKKKSFGEADEHEIRPILKSSRKSSREEFDLSVVNQDANDTLANEPMRPILKTDSPSKRRSIGGGTCNNDEINSSLLKRRTRSLERQDTEPGINLAAALDAITNSQSATAPAPAAPSSTTPVEFVHVSGSISVADRIKHMELLATTQSTTASNIYSSFESPLQQSHTSQLDPYAPPRLLKPSVLRRDLYRERYKTQPVTSEEKSFFKANSTPFDISVTSAFKPTKPLDICVNTQLQQQQQQLLQQQQPLVSPLTGQPLSHVPAPLLLSSSTHSGTGSSFRLTRSSTQPLQSPRVLHRAGAFGGTPAAAANTSASLHQHSGTDTEHIFEMSGLDEDSAIQSLVDDSNASTATVASMGDGLARSNSVRARANMFQQLQQRREAAATRHSHSPPPPSSSQSSLRNDEMNTPNTTQDITDGEIEPSSLSLAERLAFFSSLCGSTSNGSANASRFSSRASSCYSRSPPYPASIERTPRSSMTCSSASVTPTPMECSQMELPMEPQEQQHQQQQQPKHQQQPVFHELSRSSTAPTSTTINTILQPDATPTRHVRLRTVGKLVLPGTFLSDRNNNNSNQRNSCMGRLQMMDELHFSLGTRTIGKIKSPFIEQQEQQQQQQQQQSLLSTPTDKCPSKSIKLDYRSSPQDSSDDMQNSDSGKENCAANQQQQQQQQLQQQQHEPQQQESGAVKVQEMRRKLTSLTQITVQRKPTQNVINRRHTTEIANSELTAAASAASNRLASRSNNVAERYAKYFGLNESFNSTTTLLKTRTTTSRPQEALNEHVRLPLKQSNHKHLNGLTCLGAGPSLVQKRREYLKRARSSSGAIEITACSKRSHSPNGVYLGLDVASYEEILITPDELHTAERLCGEILD